MRGYGGVRVAFVRRHAVLQGVVHRNIARNTREEACTGLYQQGATCDQDRLFTPSIDTLLHCVAYDHAVGNFW